MDACIVELAVIPQADTHSCNLSCCFEQRIGLIFLEIRKLTNRQTN